MKIQFKDYLHGELEEEESYQFIYDQLKANAADWDEDFEDWCQNFGNPFYEVTLHCEYDTETGKTEIIEAHG